MTKTIQTKTITKKLKPKTTIEPTNQDSGVFKPLTKESMIASISKFKSFDEQINPIIDLFDLTLAEIERIRTYYKSLPQVSG